MSASFKWFVTSQSGGCDLVWNAGNGQRSCDEIRLGFVSDHVGIDTQFTGPMFARLAYVDANSNMSATITPQVVVTMGDQSNPARFTLQAVIKLDRPIEIRKNSQVALSLAPFPHTASASSTVTANQRWFIVAYFLRGNEDSLKLAST